MKVLVLLSILALASAVPVPAIEEKQRSWRLESKLHYRLANDLLEYHEKQRRSKSNYLPLYPDAPILTYVTVGTPRIDSFWLLDKSYPSRNISINQPYYDPDRSSTSQYVGNYTGFSGDLEALGDAYDDVLSMWPKLNATQRFGVIKQVNDPLWVNPSLPDGVIGYSWNPADKDNVTSDAAPILNLFAELAQQGISKRYYTQWLEDQTDPEYGRLYTMWTSFGSNLDGMCDPDYNMATLTYNPSTTSLEFMIKMFTYEQTNYAGGTAKVDTGVPAFLLPADTFVSLYSSIGPNYNYQYGIYEVPCTAAGQLPDFVFTIANQKYTIPSKSYVVDLLLGQGNCALSIEASDAFTTDYVLGTPFHWLYCIKMDIDNTEIGFSNNLLPQSIEAPQVH
ncbi:Peptidase A1 domain-containing protein [Aphelenchoides besseyi]|nr:Peptidase A1 domain-containing protein [Aphelenchoides besseyi]KAI6198973.1 Peptidase A1 domain-containing protein [Aphelenchoides besseyi]